MNNLEKLINLLNDYNKKGFFNNYLKNTYKKYIFLKKIELNKLIFIYKNILNNEKIINLEEDFFILQKKYQSQKKEDKNNNLTKIIFYLENLLLNNLLFYEKGFIIENLENEQLIKDFLSLKIIKEIIWIDSISLSLNKKILEESEKKEINNFDLINIKKESLSIKKIIPFKETYYFLIKVLKDKGYTIIDNTILSSSKYDFDITLCDKFHPARKRSESFYLLNSEKEMLRSHTTSTMFQEILRRKNKEDDLKIAVIGKVFRREEEDSTHLEEFHQLDVFIYSKKMNIFYAMDCIRNFLKDLGFDNIVFRPGYFPFTEPSFEIDILKNNKQIELLGGGIFRPQINKNLKLRKDWLCLGLGLGIERLSMILNDIEKIQNLFR